MRYFAAFIFIVTITGAFYIIQQHFLEKYNKVIREEWKDTKQSYRQPPLYIAVVCCGQRLQETLTMIKSALIYNTSKDLLHFLIFAEDNLLNHFREKLSDWKELLLEFDFRLLPLHFPEQHEREWRTLFKPCAAQRLFLPSLLNSIDSLLYVDTDILFVSPVSDIWKYFSNFNSSQIAALVPEHEDANIGWYNRFARHPYYGPLGVNSGVMLMNLTRMREFNWESHIVPIHEEYKLRITWGDQDIINILFYFHPEKLFIIPCAYNYRPDHCMYMSVCNISTTGVKIMHGNRGSFHSNKQPLYRSFYETIEQHQLSSTFEEYYLALEQSLSMLSVVESNCGKITEQVLYTSKQIMNQVMTT